MKTKILPPRTVLRLKRLWPHARKKGHEIGEIRRVGYYSPQDGLEVVWLVNNNGDYNWTADYDWIKKHFEILELSKERSLYGGKRPKLGNINKDDLERLAAL
jgi:hypothetical protein